MKTYTVTVERDGQFWLIHVPDVDRYTQARHLREVKEMAKDLIGIMEGLDSSEVELDLQLHLPGEVSNLLKAARIQREHATRANAEAARATRAAAGLLSRSGLTVRDVGAVLGVSHQRAHQLLTEGDASEATAALDDARRLLSRKSKRKVADGGESTTAARTVSSGATAERLERSPASGRVSPSKSAAAKTLGRVAKG